MNHHRCCLILTLIITLLFAMKTEAQETLDRTKVPAGQPVPKVELPRIQKTILKNGLNIWLVEDHKLPLVALNLVVQSGSTYDPDGKSGVASMTAGLLDVGTRKRDVLKIAEELDFIGASLRISSTFDGTFMQLNTLTKHLNAALDVYTDVLADPTFPASEFERVKKLRLTSLLQQKDRPATIAGIAFSRIVYGDSHPYGNDPSGTEKSIADLRREDVVQFYHTHYRPNNGTLIVVGDITLRELSARLEKTLATWQEAPVPAKAFSTSVAMPERRIYLVDKPGAAQSEIRIGAPAVARSTPDFFAVSILNRILGGQYSSRVNLNLRERHGYTYGARTQFGFYKQAGPFVASAGVQTAKTDSSIKEFMYEIDRMFAEGATPEEVEFAKKGFIGNFALTFETPLQVANALQNIVLYDLPEYYYSTYLQNIGNVSGDDVRQASKKYLDPSKMAIVVVGDLKTVKGGVEKLNLGKAAVCDVSGKVIAE